MTDSPPPSPKITAKEIKKKSLNPVVPSKSVSSRTLIIVIAIMAFLACITWGAVTLISDQAKRWQSNIAQEVTIQVRPQANKDISTEIRKAISIAEETSGVRAAILMSNEETTSLLEPWLGTGLNIEELPIPRIIIVELDANDTANLAADMAAMKQRLTNEVSGASLDDHRAWLSRLTSMARATVLIGFSLMSLVLASMVLSITFATHGAMSSNNDIIEVLHLVGAKDGYIAQQFQQRFLLMGLKGGIIGGLAAWFVFIILHLWSSSASGSPQEDQISAFFGNFQISWAGYVGSIALVLLIAAITALTSRITVKRYLTKTN